PPCEESVGVLNPETHGLAPVLEALVAHERPGEQAGLTQDLEAGAGAQYQATLRHEVAQGLHDRRSRRHRTGPEIVAVGEAAGQDHAIEAAQVGLAMPDVANGMTQDIRDDI